MNPVQRELQHIDAAFEALSDYSVTADEAEALADAALDLEQERVERALAWDRAKLDLRRAHLQLQAALARFADNESALAASNLYAKATNVSLALHELERLEGEGV